MLLARLRRGRVRGHAVPRAGLSTGSSFRTAAPPQGDRWREEVEAKLSKVLDPVLGRSVVDLEMVFDIAQKGGGPPEDHETWESLMEPSVVEVTLALPTGAYPEREALVQAVGEAVASVRWVDRAVVLTRYARPRPPPTVNRTKLLTGLRHVGSLVAVYSCKGGVGKSTVATNLAYSLAARGGRVGIFDADVYGPSLPAMVSPTDTSIRSTDGKLLLPIEYEGVKCMSYGWAAGPSEEGADDAGTGSGRATVARGAIVSGTIVQLLGETDWGELDYLILDLPPGTGDIQLTLTQQITPPITAAVVVSTPHHLAHIDALKGVDMFERTAVPTVAVVENMAYFDGDDGKRYYPFGPGHAVELAEACGLSSDHAITLPILPAVATASGGGESGGHPYVLEQPGSEVAALYDTLSEGLVATLLKHHHTANADQGGSAVPKILIDEERGVLLRYYSGVREGLPAYHIVPRRAKLRTSGGFLHEMKIIQMENEDSSMILLYNEDSSVDKMMVYSVKMMVYSVKMMVYSVVEVEARGNYAVAVNWSDGHESLYSYAQLDDLLDLDAGAADEEATAASA